MSSLSSTTLPAIQSLLNEFYQADTPNTRKREIETQLVALRSQPESWRMSLQVAINFQTNQFVWFFCTSTLEHTITRRWGQLSTGDRTLFRETLWNTYAAIPRNVPRRQRDTLAQLIALMGKREFPSEHPDYLNHCMELIKTNFPLGISLFRITSEEVVSNREDVSTQCKKSFHSFVSLYIPDVVELITKYLLISVCHVNGKDIHSLPNNIVDYNLSTSLPNDDQLSSSVVELLTCVQHLVSWIPTESISQYFLMSILDLSQWRDTHEDISLASLSVLNELLYLQKPLPYANILMSGVNDLLCQHNTVKQQSEMYVDKFRELLRLYTVKYWPKLINENELLEIFLNALYCYTNHKNGALDFTEKLEIWTPVIKGLATNAKLNRYLDIVHQLITEIMKRIQFEYNKTELEVLENEIMEDNNTQTEWQQYLNQCIEYIALVAEFRPNNVFAQVIQHWSRPHAYLLSIQNEIECGKSNELFRMLKSHNFCENLRDCSTVCQTVVRIAPLLYANSTNDVGSEVNCQLTLLTENLLTMLTFFANKKLHTLNVDKSNFQTDLDYLYAQVLVAIQSISTIAPQLKTESILRAFLETLGGIFQPNTIPESPIVYMAASQLLLCVSTVIRPKFLLEISTISRIMHAGGQLSHLPRQVIINVYISLISYLVLPWKNIEEIEQDYSKRCDVLKEYVLSLAENFLELDVNAESKVVSVSSNSLEIFSTVIGYFSSASNTSKDMLQSSFRPILTKALMIYSAYGLSNNTLAVVIADFTLSVIKTLQNQLGSQFVKDIIILFIAVCSREQLTLTRLTVLEKILQIFRIIVEQTGATSNSILPSILDFTINQIMPLIQHDNSAAYNSDIFSLVYALFDSVLINKWQYFYKSQVQQNGSLHYSSGANLHPEHFQSILNAYGQILVTGTDPSIVRSVLTSMQNVNEKWRLYQRPDFKNNLLASFQSALINVLVSGEGGLHFELLANALFTMGQVDILKLRESFHTVGFAVNPQLIDELCLSTDIPTFSQKLSQLMQDAHCIHLSQM